METGLIERINALAKKQREQGLTEQEAKEQQELRKKYLDNFRNNFRKMLDNIEIVDGDPQ